MNHVLTPSQLTGTIEAIASKSVAHRHLICAALSDSQTTLRKCDSSEDIEATIACLEALGASIEGRDRTLEVTPLAVSGVGNHREGDRPQSHQDNPPVLDCRESGSTLRFLLPVAATCSHHARFVGRGRLPERPLVDFTDALAQNGVSFSSSHLPLSMKGRLQSGSFILPGNISSQYITGLLLALPLLEGTSEIHLTTTLASSAYVDITLDVLAQHGVSVEQTEDGYLVPGTQRYHSPGEVVVEGDWSNAAFFLAAGVLGGIPAGRNGQGAGSVSVTGLSLRSQQGDRRVVEFLRRFGGILQVEGDRITAQPHRLHGCTLDIGETPDLLPILAVVAALSEGDTHFNNAARLRLKESDRLRTTAMMLTSLGGTVEEHADRLVVRGGSLRGGSVDSFNDHRIAMAAAIASCGCRESVTISGAEAVAKSYPAFYRDYQKLGGVIDVV